jgi:hypothetical protein
MYVGSPSKMVTTSHYLVQFLSILNRVDGFIMPYYLDTIHGLGPYEYRNEYLDLSAISLLPDVFANFVSWALLHPGRMEAVMKSPEFESDIMKEGITIHVDIRNAFGDHEKTSREIFDWTQTKVALKQRNAKAQSLFP